MTGKPELLDYCLNGVRTAVRAVGAGKPILFLHGASTLEGFDALDALAPGFRVLGPSHPGMGLSGDDERIADMTDMLVHYLNLLDALDLPEKPHLVGFSMGGWMASELAGIAGERFDRVVLVAPAGLNDPAHPATDLGGLAPQDLPAHLAHHVEVALRHFPDGSDPDAAAAFGAAREREGRTVGRLVAAHGMGHPNLRRFLHRITNPALVVWGEEDRLLPASQAPLWIEALPDAEFLSVPEAGHFVLLEKPATVGLIGEFLNK